MSVGQFRKNFANPLLEKLAAENSLRDSSQGTTGQFLLLKNIDGFKKAIKANFPGKELSEEEEKSILEGAKKAALEEQTKFKQNHTKDRYNKMVQKKKRMPVLSEYTIGKDIFIVKSFKDSLSTIRKTISKKIATVLKLTKKQEEILDSSIQKGHGENGHAVAHLDIARTIATSKNKKELKQAFEGFLEIEGISVEDTRINEMLNLFTEYKQLVTPSGDLLASYVSVIDFQYDIENRKDGVEEKAMKTLFRKFVNSEMTKDLVNWKGSSSLKDKIEKIIVNTIVRFIKNVKVKKTKSAKTSKLKTSGKATIKNKPKKSKTKTLKGPRSPQGTRATKARQSNFSLTMLIGVLNQKLSQAVEENMGENMGSPRLNYRTGRFASSVRVTDIATTAKGFPSIGYTYMKYPYQTFEPGYAQGSIQRDPRKLIDRSIRDIAADFAIGRFYTRRV